MSQILICDYCKKQKKKSELSPLPIKKPQKNKKRQRCKDGKKEGKVQDKEKIYDICNACREQLIMRLEEPYVSTPKQTAIPKQREDASNLKQVQRDISDLSEAEKNAAIENDDTIIETAKLRRQAAVKTNAKNCSHMNKGTIQGINTDEPYRICRDCRTKLPMKPFGSDNLNAKPPKGVRIHERS